MFLAKDYQQPETGSQECIQHLFDVVVAAESGIKISMLKEIEIRKVKGV